MTFFHWGKNYERVKPDEDMRRGYRKDIYCDKCDFVAINKKDLKEHKKDTHAY